MGGAAAGAPEMGAGLDLKGQRLGVADDGLFRHPGRAVGRPAYCETEAANSSTCGAGLAGADASSVLAESTPRCITGECMKAMESQTISNRAQAATKE